MVMTHAEVKRQKNQTIFVKPENPARKFMPYAQAVEDSRRLREDNEAVEKLRNELAAKRGQVIEKPIEEIVAEKQSEEEIKQEQISQDNRRIEIQKLEVERDSFKGPGSKVKKEKVQEKIDALEEALRKEGA